MRFFFFKISKNNLLRKQIFSAILYLYLQFVGVNFSEARVRRNSSPQPPPSAAPEWISWIRKIALAILQEMVLSRTVKIHLKRTKRFFGTQDVGHAKRGREWIFQSHISFYIFFKTQALNFRFYELFFVFCMCKFAIINKCSTREKEIVV